MAIDIISYCYGEINIYMYKERNIDFTSCQPRCDYDEQVVYKFKYFYPFWHYLQTRSVLALSRWFT